MSRLAHVTLGSRSPSFLASATSDAMLATMVNGANDTTGVSAFGRMWRNMIDGSETPTAMAAPT